MLDLKPSEPCSCLKCQAMCLQPCWPTSDEAKKIIEAGLGRRLMLMRWWESPGTFLLCPAHPGSEGKKLIGGLGCTFFDKGMCELHEDGLKPFEAQYAHHNRIDREQNQALHRSIAESWKSKAGQILIEQWKSQHSERAA